jgi:hypothetical protein
VAARKVQRAVGITYVPYDPSVETPDEGGTNGRLRGIQSVASAALRGHGRTRAGR